MVGKLGSDVVLDRRDGRADVDVVEWDAEGLASLACVSFVFLLAVGHEHADDAAFA